MAAIAGGGEYNYDYDYYNNYYDDECNRPGGRRREEEEEEGGPPLPLHLCFFLSIVFVFLTLSWYLSYESAVESLLDQLKLVVVLSPLVLLLAVHWLSGAEPGRRLPLLLPLPDDRDSLHRAGGSPWGVALLLLLLLLMLSYHSHFQHRCFPLLGR